jgi:hypothetical protein
MRFIVFLFTPYVLSMSPKLCIHCKHFRGEFLMDPRFGKCAKSPVVSDVDEWLVTGRINHQKREYNYCSIVRKYNPACGPDGKLFEQK